jgi:phenylacetic acid degradation operon negative regulatory protein
VRARPRSLLLTLYGAYLRDLGGWAAVADLVTLLEDVDVAPQSTRSAISRMKQAGTLEAERRNGVAGYALTDEAVAMLRDGDQVIYHSIEPPNGEWAMVVFSVPEAQRGRRHQLRKRLTRLGFGQLSSGVWIAPHPALRRLGRMLRSTGLDQYVTTWTARPEDASAIEDRAGEAWDLGALASAYREFSATYDGVIDTPMDDRDAFATYLRMLSHWRRLPFMDPGLPPALLPQPWPGAEARALFTRSKEALEPAGRRHVMATLGVTPSLQAP